MVEPNPGCGQPGQQAVDVAGHRVLLGETALGEESVEHGHGHHVLGDHLPGVGLGERRDGRLGHGLGEPGQGLAHLGLVGRLGVQVAADQAAHGGGAAAPRRPVLPVADELHHRRGHLLGQHIRQRQLLLHAVGVAGVVGAVEDAKRQLVQGRVDRVDGHIQALVVGPQRPQNPEHLLEVAAV